MNVQEAIDLRSDTVTRPTPEMRAAMAAAEVGDDVYGEDPTVNRLQELAAEIMGKEAALFVPSGTMGNQTAIHVHTRPGQEVITEERSHVFNYEMAAMAAVSGVIARPVISPDGILSWPQIEAAIRPRVYYLSPTGLIAIENTHNMAGGTVYEATQVRDICEHAQAAGIPVHMDGARIFNAAAALGTDAAALCAPCDSVMFCLSKGLGAPVGSLLAGPRTFIDRARSVRKMLGGGMRQVGVLAAAGIIALQKMPARLHEDHANAKLLAQLLSEIPELDVDPARVRTNIVIVGLSRTPFDSARVAARLKAGGLLVGTVDARTIRLLTHLDVGREQMYEAARIFKDTLKTATGD
jgi:threonine aldolase